jgi:hypothetical protein
MQHINKNGSEVSPMIKQYNTKGEHNTRGSTQASREHVLQIHSTKVFTPTDQHYKHPCPDPIHLGFSWQFQTTGGDNEHNHPHDHKNRHTTGLVTFFASLDHLLLRYKKVTSHS